MEIEFHKKFKKQYRKLPEKFQLQFDILFEQFLANPNDPSLHVHKLHGDKKDFYSLNINADYRALFRMSPTLVVFYNIGTHSELYG